MVPKPFSEKVANWLAERIPAGWFSRPVEVTVDNEEILVVGELDPPALPLSLIHI